MEIYKEDIETFLKLKLREDFVSFVETKMLPQDFGLSYLIVALESVPDSDLPLYVNHPSGPFREMIMERLKGTWR